MAEAHQELCLSGCVGDVIQSEKSTWDGVSERSPERGVISGQMLGYDPEKYIVAGLNTRQAGLNTRQAKTKHTNRPMDFCSIEGHNSR